ncbi:MAG: hypothetical protein ABI574_00535 [Burkholderiales bacterium]
MFDILPAPEPVPLNSALAPEAAEPELGYEAAFPYLTPSFVTEAQASPWPPVALSG